MLYQYFIRVCFTSLAGFCGATPQHPSPLNSQVGLVLNLGTVLGAAMLVLVSAKRTPMHMMLERIANSRVTRRPHFLHWFVHGPPAGQKKQV